jgi:hypothetical protein
MPIEDSPRAFVAYASTKPSSVSCSAGPSPFKRFMALRTLRRISHSGWPAFTARDLGELWVAPTEPLDLEGHRQLQPAFRAHFGLCRSECEKLRQETGTHAGARRDPDTFFSGCLADAEGSAVDRHPPCLISKDVRFLVLAHPQYADVHLHVVPKQHVDLHGPAQAGPRGETNSPQDQETAA